MPEIHQIVRNRPTVNRERGTHWTDRALCAKKLPTPDDDKWFSSDPDVKASARSVCARCPVKAECAAAGEGEDWGIWGGEDKTLPDLGDYPACAGGCGKPVRPAGTTASDHPGTVLTIADGHCRACWRRVTNQTYPATECSGCGRTMRRKGQKLADHPGTVSHHGLGKCTTCYRGGSPQNPRQARTEKCLSCDAVLRPAHTRAADYPGTRGHKGRGLCATCYDRAHYQQRKNEE